MIKLIVDSTYDFTKEEADALGIDIVALKTQLDLHFIITTSPFLQFF